MYVLNQVLHNGRTLVFDRQTPCPALDRQLTSDHLRGSNVCYRSASQADSAFHPCRVDK